MKKSITFEEARPANDPESNNGDSQKRALEFHLLVLAVADSVGADDKHKFANMMYDYLRPMSEEALMSLVSDLSALNKANDLFQKGVLNMLVMKIVNGGKAPSPEEAREQEQALLRRKG